MGGKYFASKSNIKNHQDIHKETLFEHDQLDIIFFQNSTLAYHQAIFNGDKTFKLDQYNNFLDQELFLFYQKIMMNQFLLGFQLVETNLFRRSNMAI